MHYKELKAAWAELTAPGAPFEIGTIEVRGEPMRVYKNAPPNVRALWLSTAAFAERDYLVYQDERMTYGEAHAKVNAIAGWLAAQRRQARRPRRHRHAQLSRMDADLLGLRLHRRRRGRHERLVGGRGDGLRPQRLHAQGDLLRRRAPGADPGAAGRWPRARSWWRRGWTTGPPASSPGAR